MRNKSENLGGQNLDAIALQELLGTTTTIEYDEEENEYILRTSTGVVLAIQSDGPTYDCPLRVIEEGSVLPYGRVLRKG